jgi:hypothetical protein
MVELRREDLESRPVGFERDTPILTTVMIAARTPSVNFKLLDMK